MGVRVGVAEFLEKVSKLKKKEDKVEALRINDSFVLRTILQGAFDSRIKWLLPEGEPPYKPNDLVDQENVLIKDARKLAYFVEGPYPGLKQVKREQMFIEMLETVAPADAKLLCAIKEKKLPWKGITADIVREAFPGFIPE
jgi:Family of unknown function (DUF6433)